MPTYGYKCQSCSYEYEKRESFSAPAKQKCPKCGKQAQRQLFAPPVVFKGSGFYKTDSRGSTSSDSGSSSSSSGDDAAPAAASSDDVGHGHTHGPGGHTHDTPAAKPDKKAKPSATETAAAS